LKLTDDTLVIFTSDNGGTHQYTAPLRGSKGQLYEGGIRVPLAVSWSGLKQRGSTCNAPVSTVDWYPTLLELAGIQPPKGHALDGVSLVPAFRGASELARPRLFWHFPCYVGAATPSSAIREGDFKLIEFFEDGGRRELYDLKSDPSEQRDLAASMPGKAAELRRTLQTWQEETGAAIPGNTNANYDPHAQRSRGKAGGITSSQGANNGKGKGKKRPGGNN
jgi:arylsulfatase A-like enzyme